MITPNIVEQVNGESKNLDFGIIRLELHYRNGVLARYEIQKTKSYITDSPTPGVGVGDHCGTRNYGTSGRE